MTELFIAFRYIKERKFQSIVSILGIAIALTVFIVSLSISNGLRDNMLNSILTLNSHITVYSTNDKYIREYDGIIDELKDLDNNIISIDKKMKIQGLIRTEYTTKGMQLLGLENNSINVKILKGSNKLDKKTDIIVGDQFLKSNLLNIGDSIKFITADNREIHFTIKGSFKTGYQAYDDNILIGRLDTAQILSEQGEVLTDIGINISNPTSTKSIDIIKDKINLLENNDNIYSYSWMEENQGLLNAIQFEKFVLISILAFLLIISSFAISVILNMIVREKISDIGILKAIGYTSKNIRNIFVIQGLIIGQIGVLLSIVLSPIVITFLKIIFKKFITSTYYLDVLPISISIIELLIIYISSSILVLLSTLLPAHNAAKLEVTESIKYNN